MPKHTSLVREVRGNALWDAIKFIFRLAGGATLLTTALSATLHFLESVSLNVKLIVGMFLCSFLFLGLAFLVGRMRRPEPTAAPVETQPPLTNFAARECSDKWLHEIALHDRRQIDDMVRLTEIERVYQSYEQPSPCIKYRIVFFNGSVFSVSIQPKVGGFISFGQRRLEGELTMSMNWDANDLPRGMYGPVEIQQWLTEGDVDHLKNGHRRGDEYFNLEQVVITLIGADAFYDVVTPRPLKIRGGMYESGKRREY
jgi:hypothetical protein